MKSLVVAVGILLGVIGLLLLVLGAAQAVGVASSSSG
jgi:hypothetical protein